MGAVRQDEIFYSPMGFLNINENAEITEINSAAAVIMGIEKTKRQSNFLNSLLYEDIPKFSRLLEQCKLNLKPLSGEFRLISSNGILTVYLTSIPFDQDGDLFYKIIFDPLKDRFNAHNILFESEKRFRLMADNSPVMIWMTNADNELEYMNKTKLDFLGKNMSDLANDGWIETRHPEDREKFLNAILDASRERRNFSIEIRVKDKEGRYRWLLDSAAPRFLDDNSFAGLIGSGIDITEEKNFRIYLQKSLKEKEVLLTEIHHRVKNNLQIISSLLSLQAAAVDDENINAMFQTSRDRIRSMAVLHEKLYQSESIHKVNLKEYLNDLLSYLMMSYKQSSKIELKLETVDIEVDIGLCLNIGLILNELVSNALKHAFKESNKGEIYVFVSQAGEDKIRIMVQDDGVGIPQDFDIDKSRSVGLMLVKTLTDQHNGSMEISSDGRTFLIELQYQPEKPINEYENQPIWDLNT